MTRSLKMRTERSSAPTTLSRRSSVCTRRVGSPRANSTATKLACLLTRWQLASDGTASPTTISIALGGVTAQLIPAIRKTAYALMKTIAGNRPSGFRIPSLHSGCLTSVGVGSCTTTACRRRNIAHTHTRVCVRVCSLPPSLLPPLPSREIHAGDTKQHATETFRLSLRLSPSLSLRLSPSLQRK